MEDPQVLGVPPELALNTAWGTGMWQEKRGLAGRPQLGAQLVLSCSGSAAGTSRGMPKPGCHRRACGTGWRMPRCPHFMVIHPKVPSLAAGYVPNLRLQREPLGAKSELFLSWSGSELICWLFTLVLSILRSWGGAGAGRWQKDAPRGERGRGVSRGISRLLNCEHGDSADTGESSSSSSCQQPGLTLCFLTDRFESRARRAQADSVPWGGKGLPSRQLWEPLSWQRGEGSL